MSGASSAAALNAMAYTPARGKSMLTAADPVPETYRACDPSAGLGTAPTPSTATRVFAVNPGSVRYTPASPDTTHGPAGPGRAVPAAAAGSSNPPFGTPMSSASPSGLDAPK